MAEEVELNLGKMDQDGSLGRWIFSSDDHILETNATFKNRVAAKHAEAAPSEPPCCGGKCGCRDQGQSEAPADPMVLLLSLLGRRCQLRVLLQGYCRLGAGAL